MLVGDYHVPPADCMGSLELFVLRTLSYLIHSLSFFCVYVFMYVQVHTSEGVCVVCVFLHLKA